MNPESNCYDPPLNPHEEDEEEIQEVSASLDAANEISVDASVLSELGGILQNKECH